jgi:hypothetical protein
MESRVMTDTGRLLRTATRAALAALALLAFQNPGRMSAAEPEPRVLWVRGDHVYASLPDSTLAEEGDRVTFRDRKKRRLAAGEVADVIRGEVALVRLDSGSLARIRKLDQVRLLFERAPLPPLGALRIGVPSARRRRECGDLVPGAAAPGYRTSLLNPMTWRLVRDPADSAHAALRAPAAWPDTLVVSLFDESADEEIALDRGDLDVAVFQPGELSARMRGDPRVSGPVVVGTAHRRRVIAMGAEALAGLMECRKEEPER